MKLRKSSGEPMLIASTSRHQALLDRRPERLRDVGRATPPSTSVPGTRRRRAPAPSRAPRRRPTGGRRRSPCRRSRRRCADRTCTAGGCVAIVFHMPWKVPVEPVKCRPANAGLREDRIADLAAASRARSSPRPGGSPASIEDLHDVVVRRGSTSRPASRAPCCPSAPATVGRLPPMAVKLNGVTAKTKPSSGR